MGWSRSHRIARLRPHARAFSRSDLLMMAKNLCQDGVYTRHHGLPSQGGKARAQGVQLTRQARLEKTPHVAAVVPAGARKLEQVIGFHGLHSFRHGR